MLLVILASVFLTALPVLSTPLGPFRHENALINKFERLSIPLLEVFQVSPPPISPKDLTGGSTACSFTLMNHVFGNSAGEPYVGTYEPLCGDNWDIAVLNLSVVSFGRQFDRLGSIWIADTEVWRTCTAEPTWSGIHFTFSKDITAFRALLQSPQQLVVDIDNYIVGPYNGSFNASLFISFYNLASPLPQTSSDQVIPLSKPLPNGVNTYFSLPDDNSSTLVSIPPETSRLVLDIFASGNGDEESWYSNTPDAYLDTFQQWNVSFLGQGSYREIMTYIDGVPAGVAWPYEVVFTGGICPGFWRPIVGHRTFDLPTYRIDMTPFIPLLINGTHYIEFAVLGEPSILENWYVSGQLHVWYANSSDLTNDYPLSFHGSPDISPRANVTIAGVVASDNTSFVVTSSASRRNEMYTVEYENQQSNLLLQNGSVLLQNLTQTTYFSSPASRGHFIFNLDTLQINYPNGSFFLNATLSQTFHCCLTNALDECAEMEHAEVRSKGVLFVDNTNVTSQGNTSVALKFNSPRREYFREVKAIGLQIVSDYEMDDSIKLVFEEVGQ